MPILSVIVPIYNVEKYLRRCVSSVLEQNFKDYELILVDDGSPDNCASICDEYENKDERVRVIHKKNGGLSDARNAGMKVAKGDYILFLDGDDYMSESGLKEIMTVIHEKKQIDMVICPLIRTYPTGENKVEALPIDNKYQVQNLDMLLNLFESYTGIFWGAGKNIYRRSIIEENYLKFKIGLIGAEDCDFFMSFLLKSSTFLLHSNPIVHYRLEREGSITNVMSKMAIMGQFVTFYNYYNLFYANKNEKMKRFFANKFANTTSLMFNLKSKNDINEAVDFIQLHKQILKDTQGYKYLAAKVIWSIFGFYKGSIILKKINSKINSIKRSLEINGGL